MMLCLLLSLTLIHPVYAAAPTIPTVTVDQEQITISNYDSGATLKVYASDGSVKWQQTNVTTSSVTLDLLPDASFYYVTQVVGGDESTNTPFFNTSLRTPIATAGVEYIDVSNVSGNTTLELYNASTSALVSTIVSSQGNGVYRFDNVVPTTQQYYIIQSINGKQSGNTPFLTSSLRVPAAVGGAEYVDLSNIYPGATVTLHQSDGTPVSGSPTDQGNGVYRFASVPAGQNYFVTQMINGVVATSNSVNVTEDRPDAPSIVPGDESLTVNQVIPGATLNLYTTTGTLKGMYPTVSTATYTINDIVPDVDWYYVTQTVDGKESVNSNFANPTLHIPTAVGGVGYIDVSHVTAGALLNLYDAASGVLVSNTAADQGDGVYRFENVMPRSGMYYVTQSMGGRESLNTPFINSSLPTPAIASGIGYIDVTNVYAGASVILYKDQNIIATGPDDLGNGTYRFAGVPADSGYYVVQSINGVLSEASSMVTVHELLPDAPTVAAMDESIQVSGYVTGATLKLYRTDGTLIRTSTSVTGSVYTMEDVLPDPLYYYVTQTVDGKESPNSAFVNSILRIPSVTAGVESIDVSNVSPQAILKLYDVESNTVASSTYLALGNGVFRFENVVPREGFYYVTQAVYGVESENSVFVNPILRTPVAAAGREWVEASNIYPGAAIRLYRSSTNEELSIQPADLGNGTFRFEGVTPKGSYYVVQFINNVASPKSNIVDVLEQEPDSTDTGTDNPTIPSTSQEPATPVDVLINGQVQKAGTLIISVADGRIVRTLQLNTETMRSLLSNQPNGAVVTIPFASSQAGGVMVSELTGDLVRLMQQKGVLLEIRTPIAIYRLPAQQIRLTEESGSSLSTDQLSEVKVRVTVSAASAADKSSVDRLVAAGGYELVGSPVSFEITTLLGGKAIVTDHFADYVERLIPIPDGVNSNRILTAVVLDGNGQLRHLPTRIVTQDGGRYASVKSLSNSTYALITNKQTFSDIRENWAVSAIEEMASRLIVQGTGSAQFQPQRSITRAEFASILVNGLGLNTNSGSTGFSDVSADAWYSNAVSAAVQYKLILGYDDNTFRPQQGITRAEAMAMLLRAMELTHLSAGSASGGTANLQQYADQEDVPAWAREAAEATIQAGLINGLPENRLAPQQSVTRAEVTTMIQRLLSKAGLI
ncbi:S-layer homology domain-containing protein [Paenibacillus sinensis]|nr:S-layer homology domain-containing protein [Paenibacillus sinensis]